MGVSLPPEHHSFAFSQTPPSRAASWVDALDPAREAAAPRTMINRRGPTPAPYGRLQAAAAPPPAALTAPAPALLGALAEASLGAAEAMRHTEIRAARRALLLAAGPTSEIQSQGAGEADPAPPPPPLAASGKKAAAASGLGRARGSPRLVSGTSGQGPAATPAAAAAGNPVASRGVGRGLLGSAGSGVGRRAGPRAAALP